jgi:hypothetical protein
MSRRGWQNAFTVHGGRCDMPNGGDLDTLRVIASPGQSGTSGSAATDLLAPAAVIAPPNLRTNDGNDGSIHAPRVYDLSSDAFVFKAQKS